MQEKIIEIGTINPLDLFGENGVKLKQLQTHFSRLKIVHRGNELKIFGNEEDIKQFDQSLQLVIRHFEYYSNVTRDNIENILNAKNNNNDLKKK